MSISWGYSPKVIKYIPLGDFPIDNYLLVARQAMENLGWNISHISNKGIIAYTGLSFQSYSEEISVKFEDRFAVVKSECIGIQLLFNDYGKNQLNLDKFFHEFEYVEFHLQEIWDESLMKLREFVADQDVDYFEKAPLTIKNKIKNVFYLFIPQRGYMVTPILLYFNILYFLSSILVSQLTAFHVGGEDVLSLIEGFWSHVFANNRDFVFKGQVWRLFTYQFVHLHFLHLFFNMYALIYLGLMVEHKLQSRNFLLIYIASGFCGGLASMAVHDVGYSIGASGAIMGVFGAFIALLVSSAYEKNAAKALLFSTGIVVAFTLVNGITGNADNAAHTGGLVAGFVFSYILINRKVGRLTLSPVVRSLVLTCFLGIFIGVVIWFSSNSHFKQFDRLADEFEANSEAYAKIAEIPTDGSTLSRMKMVREYGMDVWEQNARIVTSMRELQLDAAHRKIIDYYVQVTILIQSVEYMRYRFIQTRNPAARKQFDKFNGELKVVTAKAKREVGIDFPSPIPLK